MRVRWVHVGGIGIEKVGMQHPPTKGRRSPSWKMKQTRKQGVRSKAPEGVRSKAPEVKGDVDHLSFPKSSACSQVNRRYEEQVISSGIGRQEARVMVRGARGALRFEAGVWERRRGAEGWALEVR